MSIKYLFLFLFVLSFWGCAFFSYNREKNEFTGVDSKNRKFVSFESISINLYWGWGLMYVQLNQIYLLHKTRPSRFQNILQKDDLCNSIYFKSDNWLGEIATTSASNDETVDLACGYLLSDIQKNYMTIKHEFADLLKNSLNREFMILDADTSFQVIYWGDSLEIESEQIYNHRTVNYSLKNLNLQDIPDSLYLNRSVYEFYLPKKAFVYSLKIKMNPSFLKDYEPLKIDPKLLPLESPKYKALKASEETLKGK